MRVRRMGRSLAGEKGGGGDAAVMKGQFEHARKKHGARRQREGPHQKRERGGGGAGRKVPSNYSSQSLVAPCGGPPAVGFRPQYVAAPEACKRRLTSHVGAEHVHHVVEEPRVVAIVRRHRCQNRKRNVFKTLSGELQTALLALKNIRKLPILVSEVNIPNMIAMERRKLNNGRPGSKAKQEDGYVNL